ncbi:MAG: hypothetical protein ABIO46_05660, partial [Chitinophagales bacterium]
VQNDRESKSRSNIHYGRNALVPHIIKMLGNERQTTGYALETRQSPMMAVELHFCRMEKLKSINVTGLQHGMTYQKIVRQAQSTTFIAHNRLASDVLEAQIDGAHPFFYQPSNTPYTFSHNGSIHSFLNEAKMEGTLDSRIFLQHLIDEQERRPGSSKEAIVASIAKTENYDSLCSLPISPDSLKIWRIFNDSAPEKIKAYEEYCTLYLSLRNHGTIIS